ncbi:hypothetical protein A3C86_00940 [Candidatus Kaiserbacteria bacterium RIFCSPHIGHO2_02_FULL_49_16]|uniref:PEF-CTERM protein sorting domain-containing protein n=1 Tax=Candidatus Kaiserbacteria bacterium RIFCSPHIGHO2_02_FULL_49_16 TaxID=1798490 RepID=A0A1F6DFA5_9BACT|nr:MAG: hypothetical protein A3C86_00940 [Candidatus Kaiserbacteria bacterium RIFCSPHIGHO2_02_FULL_49_16]
METGTLSLKKILYIFIPIFAILGLVYFFSRQKNEENNLVPAAKEVPLSAEEKSRILDMLNKDSSATATVSASKKLEILRSLEKGSAANISESDKLKILQELQGKQ